MISKKSKYALMALAHLARHPEREPVLISQIAEAEHIPRKFLEAILLALRKGGILQSRIGKGGGYLLAAAPQEITVGRVVRVLEGDLSPVQCLSEVNYARCDECADEASCGIRLVMGDVKRAIDAAFDGVTLADMVERSEAERRKRERVVDYTI